VKYCNVPKIEVKLSPKVGFVARRKRWINLFITELRKKEKKKKTV